MEKLIKTILVLSLAFAVMILFAGCVNIPAQLNNFSSEVNPLPFPTVQRLFKDAVATSHEPDSVGIISFSPDAKWYDVTLGYLCFTPIAALECGVALVNDALFLPYNLPASIFLHEDGCLTMEEGVIKWKGKVDLYDYDPAHDQLLIVDLKRGNLTLSVEGPPLGGDISFSEPGRHIVRISPPHVGFDEFASDRKNVYFTPLAKQGGKWGEFATIKKSADFVGECYLTCLDNLNAKGEAKEESK